MLCHNSTHDFAGHSSSEKTSVSRDKWNYAMEFRDYVEPTYQKVAA